MENQWKTTTISVYTRHSSGCSKEKGPNWRRCNCMKAIYIYENGHARRISANPIMGKG